MKDNCTAIVGTNVHAARASSDRQVASKTERLFYPGLPAGGRLVLAGAPLRQPPAPARCGTHADPAVGLTAWG